MRRRRFALDRRRSINELQLKNETPPSERRANEAHTIVPRLREGRLSSC